MGYVVILGFPAFITLGPILAGRLTRGRPRGHRLVLLAIALLGIALGVLLVIERTHGVVFTQGLEGGAVGAAFLLALPGAVFLELGYRVRSPLVAAVVWLAAIVPVTIYLFLVALGVEQDIQCPAGESCPIFS